MIRQLRICRCTLTGGNGLGGQGVAIPVIMGPSSDIDPATVRTSLSLEKCVQCQKLGLATLVLVQVGILSS